MKLNDMLEPTPFQFPFHLHSLRELEKRLYNHKSGYTNTHTLLSSLASHSSLVLPSSMPSFFLPFPDSTLGYCSGKDSWQHLEPGVSDCLSSLRCDISGSGGEPWGVVQVTSPPPKVAGILEEGLLSSQRQLSKLRSSWGSMKMESPVITQYQETMILSRCLESCLLSERQGEWG